MSLRKIALSTAAMSSVNVLRLLAQFMAIPLLARLLSPADYGIIGIAMPFVLFIMMIADSGLGMSLVRTSPDEREEWSTCFWLSAAMGVVLSALMAMTAPVVAYFYDEPSLMPIIMALALIILGQTLSLIPGAALQQARRFGTVALIDLSGILFGILTAVLLALNGAGVWALVGQQLVLYAIKLTGNFWFSPFRPLPIFKLDKVKSHITFGKNVLGANLIAFCSRAMENIVIGKVQGPAPVGIYSMAFQFLRLPSMIITGPLQYVIYSQLASSKDDIPYIRNTFLFLTRVLCIIVFPAMGMVAAAHEPIFHIVLSEKWAFTGEIFNIVMPASALQGVTGLLGTIMLVLGRTDIQLRAITEYSIIIVIGLLCSSWFGLEWTAFTFFAIVVLYMPRQLYLILPVIDCNPMHYMRVMAAPTLTTIIASITYYELFAASSMSNWVHAFIAAGLAFVAMVVSILMQYPVLRHEVSLLQSK